MDMRENLELQLSEVEMIESMYPGQGEFQLDDPLVVQDCQNWLLSRNNKTLPPRISFCVKLDFSGDILEVHAALPLDYPSKDIADIHVRSPAGSLSRIRQAELNSDLGSYLRENSEAGEVVVGLVIAWMQENAEKYLNLTKNDLEQSKKPSVKSPAKKTPEKLVRWWIYSHHIYSKIKRKDILDLSKEFQLTGFSMPGKPGIICLEGFCGNVNDAWSVIKSWNWKKINLKFQEEEEDDSKNRFDGFEEIGFTKAGDTRDYHMDMGEFSKYLDKHQSSYMFKKLFNL